MKESKFILILILYLICYVFASLVSPYFWFDEAGQIFISLGLNHFSVPNALAGTVADVLYNNNCYNLDPGGFSIMFFYWLKISTNHIWLRIFPYLFFIASIYTLTQISNSIHKTKNNYLYTILIFLIPQIVFRSAELRAYTMEFLSILVSVYIVVNIKNFSDKKFFLFSFISAILISSRYSSVILFGIISLVVTIYLLRSEMKNWQKFKSITSFLLPLFVSVCWIYYNTLRHQNPNLTKVDYMEYLSDNPYLLFENFNWLHLLGVFIILSLIFLERKKSCEIEMFFLVSLVVNAVFVLISFAGIYPYNPFDERNLAIFVYTFLPLIYWIGLRVYSIFTFLNNPILLITFGAVFTFYFDSSLSNNWRKNNLYTDLSNHKFNNRDVIIVKRDLIPSTKYLFEFTKHSFGLNYPEDFIFIESDSVNTDNLLINKRLNYYLITNEEIPNTKFNRIGFSLYKID